MNPLYLCAGVFLGILLNFLQVPGWAIVSVCLTGIGGVLIYGRYFA